ncbi:uncharacterized protein LOC123870687 isoform X2 [Maniola jurtina]|uniref:uncharacterized protein LOC123870687 isoform X2 n=1 Tax=Maniola jurtina TaxID=191418 RepID=UPI001E68E4FA|nr:uncharacterized protein LOC123870687 isoform X2 [Maniola jurtina]
MVGKCVVPGCDNLGQHLIPQKDSDRRCLWMKAMRLEGQIMKIKQPSICTLHFKETDYDAEYYIEPPEPLKIKRLKRHAVPSIFPWTDAPPTKRCAFTSQKEMDHSLDSETEMENVEPRDPVLIFKDDDNTTEQLSSKLPTSSSSELPASSFQMGNDYKREISFNASGVKKTYRKQHMPIKFIPELCYLPCQDLLDAPFEDPLCVQESDRQHSSEASNYYAESKIDIGNIIQIIEC